MLSHASTGNEFVWRAVSSVAIVGLTLACGMKMARSPEKTRGPEGDRSAAKELEPFSESFDTAAVSPRWKYELAEASRLQIVASPARRGGGALMLTLHPKDRVAKRNRAEIKLFNREPLGSEGWYAWSVLIPEDYADVARAEQFQILGQWHDQPPEGKAWKDYDSHTPMIAVKYTATEGKPRLEIMYGLDDKNKGIVGRADITKGKWVDLVFHVKWSMQGDGFVEAWKDGQPITRGEGGGVRVSGPNMYNSAPPYLKLGLYRKDGIETVNSVYYDEVRIGRTRADVEVR